MKEALEVLIPLDTSIGFNMFINDRVMGLIDINILRNARVEEDGSDCT